MAMYNPEPDRELLPSEDEWDMVGGADLEREEERRSSERLFRDTKDHHMHDVIQRK